MRQQTVPTSSTVPPVDDALPTGGSLTRELRAVWALWQREMLRLVRSRTQVAMTLLSPLLFLFLLGPGLDTMLDTQAPGAGGADRGSYVAYLLPGILIMAVQMPALRAGGAIVRDREAGLLRATLVAPVRRDTLLVGRCMGGASAAALQAALLLILGPLAGLPADPGLLLLLFGAMWLIAFSLTMLGALAAVLVRRVETFQAMLGMVTLPLVMLSGALFPVGALPGWLTPVILANPLTYAVDAIRRMAAVEGVGPVGSGPIWGGWQPPVALELAVMVLLGLLALVVAARRFNRMD
ncbi:ABC transporter permease [Micromonospora foliorum]|uniref:ABC transporter permease n=1 Tax=Micromonospora foliorum TaxID=2911210 RepID=UPI001EE80E2F|nr:ABC transporter permease [Micromonospora foliorum]MCG5435260.1 ABC transporter permease [Micromonospora foliorum]